MNADAHLLPLLSVACSLFSACLVVSCLVWSCLVLWSSCLVLWSYGRVLSCGRLVLSCGHCYRSIEYPPLEDVDAHPDAASPYGVLDLVGNVYQWTVTRPSAKSLRRLNRQTAACVSDQLRCCTLGAGPFHRQPYRQGYSPRCVGIDYATQLNSTFDTDKL